MRNLSPRSALLSTLFVTLGLARSANAAPLVIYSSWQGDTTPTVGRLDGGFFQYCDFNVHEAGKYGCVPDWENEPTGVRVGGIGAADLDGNGTMEWISLGVLKNLPNHAEVDFGRIEWPFLETGQSTVTNVQMEGVLFGGNVDGVIGFGVGHADADTLVDFVIAHNTTGTTPLLVDIHHRNGAVETQALFAPGMMTIGFHDPASDFINFAVDDVDGDGFANLLVLLKGEANTNTARIAIFDHHGAWQRNMTLALDPVAAARTTAARPVTYVGGFIHGSFAGSDHVNEYLVLTVDHTPGATGHGPAPQRNLLWRFNSDGNIVPDALPERQSPIELNLRSPYDGAIVLGMASLARPLDTHCDGVDEDRDGTADEDYKSQVGATCGIGPCTNTAPTSCTNGVITTAPCTPFPPVDEQLDGADNDCNGTTDDIPELPACAPGQTDWYCCPGGQTLHFAVHTYSEPVDASHDAAAGAVCFPVEAAVSSDCTLRGVVQRANQLRQIVGRRPQCSVEADLAAGTHALTYLGGNNEALHSHLVLGGGDLTIVGQGPDPLGTHIASTLASSDSHRLFVVTSADSATPTRLALRNVQLHDGLAGTTERGGAIWVKGTPRAPNTPYRVSLDVDHCVFANNRSNQPGGAINADQAEVAVRDSLFRHNECENADAVGGGQTSRGGGLFASYSHTLIERSAFVGNRASKGGGVAIRNQDGSPGEVTILNTTIADNLCGEYGCGLDLFNVDATLRFNTIIRNQMVSESNPQGKRSGGGLHGEWDPGRPTHLSVVGNIIADNHLAAGLQASDGASPDCSIQVDLGSTLLGVGNNLIGLGGEDCATLGAGQPFDPNNPNNPRLIGFAKPAGQSHSQDDAVNPKLDPLPNSPAGCDNERDWDCHNVCFNLALSSVCLAKTQPGSVAVSKATPDTCPADDQRARFIRPPAQSCTIGSFELNGAAEGVAPNIAPPPQANVIAFDDDLVFGGTAGTIVDTAGHRISVRDADGLEEGVVIVVDATGSGGNAKFSVCGGILLEVPPGTQTTFTCPKPSPIFANGGAVLGNDATFAGDLFAGSFNLGSNLKAKGTLKSAANGTLGSNAFIEGDVRVAGTLSGFRTGVTGTIVEHTTIAPQSMVLHEKESSSVTPVSVSNTSAAIDYTFAPGDYGNVTIASGATVQFTTSALYRMRSLTIGDDVTVIGSNSGHLTAIAVDGGIHAGDRLTVSGTSGSTAGASFLLYSNGTTVELGHNLFFAGSIEAPLGTLQIGNFALLRGGVGAGVLNIGNSASINGQSANVCGSNLLPAVTAVSSSAENSSFSASKAINGNSTTRWSSAFGDPQWIYVDLGASRYVDRVVLDWEAAFSSNYAIQISNSPSGPWTALRSNLFGRVGSTSVVNLVGIGRYLRMYSQARATPYGNSIYEIKVYGDMNTSCTGPIPLTAVSATSSSNESSSFGAANAIDGDLATRWSSAFSDNQSIYVDLGAPRTINRVLLSWEVAYSKQYEIRVSNDASNWTTVYTNNASNGAFDDISGLNVTARYVKMFGKTRATQFGHSLWELKVYGRP